MATLKGKAALWGVNGLSVAAVVISSTTAKIQSADFNRTADNVLLDDEVGEPVGEAFFAEKNEITIECIPIDATAVATAVTNAAAIIPTIGTTATVTDTVITDASASNSGKYNVLSASARRTNKGYCILTVTMRQFIANDVTGTVS